VKFVWAGKNVHNVFVFSGPTSFHSPTQTKGSYRKRLTRKGTYQLGCTIHAGMLLTIKVR
jgi:plastocyanin